MNRRKLLSLLGMSPALLAGSQARAESNAKKTAASGGNEHKISAPFFQVGNLSYRRSVSIDKWM
jgi:hypothetical protein